MAADFVANFTLTTAAGATDVKDLLEPATVDDSSTATQNYAPFKNIAVTNTGTTALKLYINGQKGYYSIPAGTIFVLENLLISRFAVTNTGGAAAAYIVTLDNKPTATSLLQAIGMKLGAPQ